MKFNKKIKYVVFLATTFLFMLPARLIHAEGSIGATEGCPGDKEINTAIGCISYRSSKELISFFLKWGIAIAGGISFLSLIYSGFLVLTSTGDPKRIQVARETAISSIGGILFLIFSVFILRIVGIDILHIPGFG